ncbi:uncharacterized protein LOC123673748 [Harmonia axyridis]|uniref:uncharacterized protein LOC123673748 n=1 Tax=Harmonia axyridis TaxID=115357 RepID=UPI001E275CFB|nr:uncharacterized protein LOC123673748 [Harmonia axyridis]XP_045464353.1 uncharacterized protein LOC123673748 [Harmonia axyridis]
MDDLFAKKKESGAILDLSKSVANSKEELRRILDKVPDFKIRAEKVPVENIKVKDKTFKFKSCKNDLKAMKDKYPFLNPLPNELSSLKISDLASVSIDWRMLTSARPKTKSEENYFSRIIELAKLERKTREQEKRQYLKDPQIKKYKNRAGVLETRIATCSECGEEFCNGEVCTKFSYDAFARVPEVAPKAAVKKTVESVESFKKKIKRRGRSKSKSKREKSPRKKTKSPRKKSQTKKKSNI